MEPTLVLFLLTVMMVIVIDLTDFIDSVKQGVWKWVFKDKRPYKEFRMKPFDCSLCMSFWVGLLYLIIWGQWSLPLMVFQLFLSYLTPIFKDALLLVQTLLQRMIDAVYDYFHL